MTTAEVLQIGPEYRRIRAANPSPMTFTGTNTYLIGTRDIAVIDPGPDDPAHLQAILRSLAPGQRISHILITHSHLDHSPLARPLAEATGAKTHAFGDSLAGRSAVMQGLGLSGAALAGGEGVDAGFHPDILLGHSEIVAGSDWQLQVLHTPGHFGNHIALASGDTVFTGDHVMGWSSSMVSPPDGDLTDFMASLELLLARGDDRLYLPGHGDPVTDPLARVAFLRDHRRGREAAILAALAAGPATPADLAAQIYTDVSPQLLPAAARNVFAHLIDLQQKNLVRSESPLAFDAPFHLP